jgi:pimeloyl-ACP methyl ester carboxylesterase
MIDYDEFGMLADNAAEVGLTFVAPSVRRTAVTAGSGLELSALVWGDGEPELVLLHGGAQNAHTWDTVALILDRPLVALDLPGHGHSAWRPSRDYRPQAMADDVLSAIAQLAPRATTLVGMSLGGLTALAALATDPEAADRLLLVDITPGVDQQKAAAIVNFVAGPTEFESFDVLLARTIEHNPTRSESSLRRGVLHNAHERDDGSWVWNYDRLGDRLEDFQSRFGDLWDAVSALTVPLLLARGALSPVVDDADVAELRRRQPNVEVVTVEGAGHSIQGDEPLALADLLARFHAGS